MADSIPHGTSSGFSYWKCRCDICVAFKKAKDRAYYEANREKVKAKVRKYADANRDSVKAKGRDYYARNADTLREKKRQYARDNAEANRSRVKQWRKANPDKLRQQRERELAARALRKPEINAKNLAAYHALMASNPELVREKRRAQAKTPKGVIANRAARHRRRGARPTKEALEYMAILAADPCSYCGWPGGEIDHITPITAGGDGEWTNLTAACRRCNARKNDRSLMSFLTESAA